MKKILFISMFFAVWFFSSCSSEEIEPLEKLKTETQDDDGGSGPKVPPTPATYSTK